MRLIRLNTVVLPAPLGPISVNTSPRCTSKLTLLTASTPPKRTLRFFAESSDVGHFSRSDFWKDFCRLNMPLR